MTTHIMDQCRIGEVRVVVNQVKLAGSDACIIKESLSCMASLNSSAADIVIACMNQIRMSQLMALDEMGDHWCKLMRLRMPGFLCPYIDRLHKDILEGETAYQILMRSLRKGIFVSTASLSMVFVNHPFFKVFTLRDLLKCHDGSQPVYLSACIPLSVFRLAYNGHVYQDADILTWYLSAKEIHNGQFRIESKSKEKEPMGRILNVSEEHLPVPEEEEAEEAPKKPPKKKAIHVVTVQENNPIGVICMLKVDASLKLATSEMQLLERVPRVEEGLFIPFTDISDAYKYAWPLYHATIHTRGQSKGCRVARIILYLYFHNSPNKMERELVVEYEKLLLRSMEYSPHEIKNCVYPYMKEYVSNNKRLRVEEVPDKVAQTLRKL